MDTRLTVAVSVPRNENLSKRQRRFLVDLRRRIEEAGLRILPDLDPGASLDDRIRKIQNCHGVVVMVLEQWQARRLYRNRERKLVFPSEFSHMYAVMANVTRRPLFLLREKTVAERGAFRKGSRFSILDLPASLAPDWLDSSDFQLAFGKWVEQVKQCHHVFLGYSSRSRNTAKLLQTFLTEELQLRVLDWHDFQPGEAIWSSIERAERVTNCGLFLFMADDKVARGSKPRDNVVYEAGYFAGAKGPTRSIIVRERRATVPTDLGGILYLTLSHRANIAPITAGLRRYFSEMLGA